ncbi:hypothetical protein OEA41_004854 [Lepraria neglecta]|uniref:F-box domain-containing protein n=1 Tax=Lepraria neglecta TaxID=209136 RepID=A0AAD9Z130_9LECA|nr:hypothetical protein OEA41_004854 [Lepraria neglecta]
MDKLPAELILHIALFLDAQDVVLLRLISKYFLKITRDNGLWKELCLNDSHFEAARRRREFIAASPTPVQEPRALELQPGIARAAGCSADVETTIRNALPKKPRATVRAMANWDPAYLGKKVDWYNEYIARHAPLSVSWLQQPFNDSNGAREKLESRGLGLFEDGREHMVVAPLEDGSVCLWNVGADDKAPDDRDGRIMTRSRPGLLSVNGPGGSTWQSLTKSRAKMTSTGVVECVSIDKIRNKAYFAVQSGLNEVDLSTLQISAYDRYPSSISALSEATHPIPLTVGTTLSLHIHDPRLGNNGRASSYTYFSERVDFKGNIASNPSLQNDFHRINSGDNSQIDYTTLFAPAPLSILHLNPSSTIYVAGRFPSILTYDRRFFPKLISTIHSGARLCSITSLPTPNHQTLAAAGEYNGKGSLELYPIAPTSISDSSPNNSTNTQLTRNRTSASSSKLLSLAPHGTRLVFSDGDGQLKWVERDGSTLVRRWNINTYSTSPDDPITTGGMFNNDLNEGDVVRKLLPVSFKERSEVLLWTGEKIGVLGFRKDPRFSFGKNVEEEMGSMDGVDERDYGRMMRTALERQADEVRFVRGLGLRD